MAFSNADYLAMQARLQKNLKGRATAPPDAVERESDLHELISNYCRQKGWVSVHSRMDRATTYDVGTADYIIFADKRVIIIECKTRLGKLSVSQMGFIIQMEKLGHVVHVVRGFSEFLQIAGGVKQKPTGTENLMPVGSTNPPNGTDL